MKKRPLLLWLGLAVALTGFSLLFIRMSAQVDQVTAQQRAEKDQIPIPSHEDHEGMEPYILPMSLIGIGGLLVTFNRERLRLDV